MTTITNERFFPVFSLRRFIGSLCITGVVIAGLVGGAGAQASGEVTCNNYPIWGYNCAGWWIWLANNSSDVGFVVGTRYAGGSRRLDDHSEDGPLVHPGEGVSVHGIQSGGFFWPEGPANVFVGYRDGALPRWWVRFVKITSDPSGATSVVCGVAEQVPFLGITKRKFYVSETDPHTYGCNTNAAPQAKDGILVFFTDISADERPWME